MSGELRMAAIFRADLPLPPGKMAAQSGHAFLSAWVACADKAMAETYLETGQTKIVLVAPNLEALFKIQKRAKDRGVSFFMVKDAAHTVLPHPDFTVLGLGPMNKTDYNNLTRDLPLAE